MTSTTTDFDDFEGFEGLDFGDLDPELAAAMAQPVAADEPASNEPASDEPAGEECPAAPEPETADDDGTPPLEGQIVAKPADEPADEPAEQPAAVAPGQEDQDQEDGEGGTRSRRSTWRGSRPPGKSWPRWTRCRSG
ncbi:hypothetical protein [Nonomuraea salmonea]|uniref:hypothetical protein n=1 Tax=Nonomuraea salmonea TaxID=46181 RepID=UPI002FE8F2EC